MNYERYPDEEMKCACAPEPTESLTDLARSISVITRDVLGMTRRINGHLFGLGNSGCEKETDPKCFHDELVKTKCELLATVEELSKLCVKLGV